MLRRSLHTLEQKPMINTWACPSMLTFDYNSGIGSGVRAFR